MRTGYYADVVIKEWLDLFRSKPLWAGLCQSDPRATSDPLAVEVTGRVYARPPMALEYDGLLLRNAAALAWPSIAPMNQVVAVAGFDAAFNGRLRCCFYLEGTRSFPVGGSMTLPARSVYFGIGS